MKISEIDKNLAVETKLNLPDAVWFNSKEAPFRIHGLYQVETGKQFLRMPPETAKATSEGVEWLNTHTAGGRIRFRTNSKYIAIKTDMPEAGIMPHMTVLGTAGFDLYSNDGREYRSEYSFMPNGSIGSYESSLVVDGQWHTYTINMPLYAAVNEVYIGLSSDAEIEAAEDYTYAKPILYYGSSITQGGCASRPGNSYQAMISRRFDSDYINLGFSGNGKAEDVMIEYLASIESSVFVCDYDHNAPWSDYLAATHEKLVRAYRDAHPKTPIIVVSKPDYAYDRAYYHTWRADDEPRRMIVRATYEKLCAEGDTLIGYVDGAHLFDGEFRDSCTVDGTHPNDLGFFRMAKKIGDEIEKFLK